MVRERAVAAMERGVEAGDLRQSRPIAQQRPDRRQIVRLMQRRQRHVALEPRQHLVDRPGPGGRIPGRHARRDGRPREGHACVSRSQAPRASDRGRNIRDTCSIG